MNIQRVKIVSLVLDYDYYPRNSVDSTAVSYMVDSLEDGNEFPPIVADAKTKKVIDGFHRVKAHLRHFGEHGEIDVEFRNYKSEKEMFLDAVRLNASHGVKLKRYDQARCGKRAKELRISKSLMAHALKMTLSRFNKLMDERAATSKSSNETIIIKPPIKHKMGKPLTKEQEKVIPKLGGNTQLWYINQLIHLIKNDLIDIENQNIMDAMNVLMGYINNFMLEHSR